MTKYRTPTRAADSAMAAPVYKSIGDVWDDVFNQLQRELDGYPGADPHEMDGCPADDLHALFTMAAPAMERVWTERLLDRAAPDVLQMVLLASAGHLARDLTDAMERYPDRLRLVSDYLSRRGLAPRLDIRALRDRIEPRIDAIKRKLAGFPFNRQAQPGDTLHPDATAPRVSPDVVDELTRAMQQQRGVARAAQRWQALQHALVSIAQATVMNSDAAGEEWNAGDEELSDADRQRASRAVALAGCIADAAIDNQSEWEAIHEATNG